jgi:hypothetical protein
MKSKLLMEVEIEMEGKSLFCRPGFLFLIALILSFTAGGAWAASVSGTVTNNSGKPNARVYIRATGSSGSGNPGVSIAAPGTFTIRGLSNGTYQLSAFMDSVNTGIRLANSPVGQSSQFTISNNEDEPGVNITLQPPATVTPQPPGDIFGIPGSTATFLMWEAPCDENELQEAEAYNIYWSTNSSFTPGTATGSKLNIPANDQGFAVITGLTNDTTYYFIMTSKVGGVESSPSPPSDAVAIGAPAGSYTVSGTVTFQGFTGSSKPLFIALIDEENEQMSITSVIPAAGAASAAFSMSGVANGRYELFGFVDNNSNGVLDLGDYSIAEENSPLVTVSGRNVPGVTATVTSASGFASLYTNHWKNMELANEGYGISFFVVRNARRPVNVAVTGPNISSPIDVGIDEQWGEFSSWLADISRPAVTDVYTFQVEYSEGDPGALQASPTGVLDSFATPISPVGYVPGATTPTFTWSGPASPPAWYYYKVELNDSNWGRIWETEDELPMATTQVFYDGQPLSINTPYLWNIVLSDQKGNYSMYSANFTPIDPTLTKILDASIVAGSGNGTVFVNPPGEYLPHAPFAYSVNTPVTITASPDSGSMVIWTGCDSIHDNACNVTMNTDKSVTATFNQYDYQVQLNGVGKPSIQAAFNDAVNGCTIKARALHFDEGNLNLNNGSQNIVTLKGGYDKTFTSNSGNYSYLRGIFTIMSGSLTVENIVIE